MPTITSNADVAIGVALFGFEGGQEPLLVRGAGAGGVENAGAFGSEGLHQAADQFAALAALHRRHADDGLRFAVLQPAAANRRDQPVEIGSSAGPLRR